MKILTEYKNKENTKAISTYGITIRNFKPGEAVGIYLRELYPATIDLINDLLYFKHPVTLKYNNVQYKLYSLDEWKRTYQDPKDQIKTKTELHPILKEYYDKKKEYFEKKKSESTRLQYYAIYQLDPAYQNLSDGDLQAYIREVAPMYEIDVDYSNRLDMLRAYIQLHYYLDNDIEYSRPASDIQIIPVGNPMLFDDLIYKVQNSSIPVDNIIQSMLKLD